VYPAALLEAVLRLLVQRILHHLSDRLNLIL
jgi:hypothetical protein